MAFHIQDEFVDPAVEVAGYQLGESVFKIGSRIDAVQFAATYRVDTHRADCLRIVGLEDAMRPNLDALRLQAFDAP